MPTAAAAFSIGTAKPMPMKTRWLVGIEDAGDDADDLAVDRDERAAGVARIGGGVELDQVGQQALAFRRTVLAPQSRDHARRDRRADAERKADRDHLVAERAGRPSSAASPARRSSGIVFACSTARSFSGCVAIDRRLRLGAVGEHDADALRAGDDVQVGEDDALVDDHHAGADAASVSSLVAVGSRSNSRTRTTEPRIAS